MTMFKSLLLLSLLATLSVLEETMAFAPKSGLSFHQPRVAATSSWTSRAMSSEDFTQESPQDTQERIQALVENHPVLLFMKGSKLFPQCGFSNTAVQILQSYGIDFHTVDVLSDQSIREGVKQYSNWPTIPQLYVAGEFIGGSDIMIELYQSGELGELVEKAKADMM